MTFKFTIAHEGKTYECERIVEGKRVLHQTVVVVGVGSKEDPASYGQRGHPVESMAGVACLIADEILRENTR